MNVLFLTNNIITNDLYSWLIYNNPNDNIIRWGRTIPEVKKYTIPNNYDLIISYNYKYIIPEEIINRCKNRIINLHISLLPHNRGADPNIWSILDDTPKGVTIHFIDKGIDTGQIIYQKEVYFNEENDTLKSSYSFLHYTIQNLFKENWQDIRNFNCIPDSQKGKGSYHNKKDLDKLLNREDINWEVCIKDFKEFFNSTKTHNTNTTIDKIQNVRNNNNKLWMDILRLAFKYAPEQAKRIFSQIQKNDLKITEHMGDLVK